MIRVGRAGRRSEDRLIQREKLRPAGNGKLEPPAEQSHLVLGVNSVAALADLGVRVVRRVWLEKRLPKVSNSNSYPASMAL